MKILVLGGHGFVGKNFIKSMGNTSYKVIPLSRRDGLDLTDYNLTQKYFKEIKPVYIKY